MNSWTNMPIKSTSLCTGTYKCNSEVKLQNFCGCPCSQQCNTIQVTMGYLAYVLVRGSPVALVAILKTDYTYKGLKCMRIWNWYYISTRKSLSVKQAQISRKSGCRNNTLQQIWNCFKIISRRPNSTINPIHLIELSPICCQTWSSRWHSSKLYSSHSSQKTHHPRVPMNAIYMMTVLTQVPISRIMQQWTAHSWKL